jgi:hypothetical protein
VSAAEKREELEAAVHGALTGAYRRGRTAATETITGPFASELILALADEYANAVADDWLAKHVYDTIAGRERLAELDAAIRSGS